MARKVVNLDALIPRADLDEKNDSTSSPPVGGIPVTELRWGGVHQSLLRKPDFQRETDDWDVENVATLIRSLCDGHLIPALIMWAQKDGYLFVIDGAHRLSALIAWVNDDYGDGPVSRKFFGNDIPRKQIEAAEACRNLVRETVGNYADVISTAINDTPQRVRTRANLASSLPTQQVHGDSDAAQTSFFAINQRSVQINPTEQYLIEARKKANVIAARAILRSAMGHQYWSKFDEKKRKEIEAKAKSIYSAIFRPDSLSKGVHYLPIAGESQTGNSLRIVVDLISIATAKSERAWTDSNDDIDGSETLRVLNQTHAAVKIISGSHGSLGLHPYIYFWSATGNHSPAAFLAAIEFFRSIENANKMFDFVLYRARFENILSESSDLLKHISGTQGGWKKSLAKIRGLYEEILRFLQDGKDDEYIRAVLSDRVPSTKRLTTEQESSPRISKGTKAAVRRRLVLDSSIKCWICHAKMMLDDVSHDHKVKASDGGLGNEENIEPAHGYCNTGFRNYAEKNGLSFPKDPYP